MKTKRLDIILLQIGATGIPEMTALASRISMETIRRVARRAERIAQVIDEATEKSSDRRIRETGAQLIDLLAEWVEEIYELQVAEDLDVEERLQSFWVRLHVAEEKIAAWPLTQAQLKKLRGVYEPTKKKKNRKRKRGRVKKPLRAVQGAKG